jgi:nickel-type superoxide dismutase maturation protease
VTLALALAVLVAGARSVRRIEVAGASMSPALEPGDRLLVIGTVWSRFLWPRPGDVVAVRDPRHPGRTLVKRVAAIHRAPATVEVLGDARGASTDSRAFGPVPRSSIVGLAVYRYAPLGRKGPAPWPEEYHQA